MDELLHVRFGLRLGDIRSRAEEEDHTGLQVNRSLVGE